MNKNILSNLFISILIGVIFWFVSRKMSIVVVFIPGMIISFLLYLRVVRPKFNSKDLLDIYLVALAVQMLHFLEEYLTNFTTMVPALFGADPYPLSYWIAFNMIAYAVFILGGVILLKDVRSMMIIPLFFIVVGVFLNAIGHLLLALYAGGYFSGLYTALIYLIIGPVIVKMLLGGRNQERIKEATNYTN